MGGDSTQRGPFFSGARSCERVPRVFESAYFASLFCVQHGGAGVAAKLSGSHRIISSGADANMEQSSYVERLEKIQCGDVDADLLSYFNNCMFCGEEQAEGLFCCAAAAADAWRCSASSAPSAVPTRADDVDSASSLAPARKRARSSRLPHVQLFSRNIDCKIANDTRLAAIESPSKTFTASDELSRPNGRDAASLLSQLDHGAVPALTLKVGTRVLTTRLLTGPCGGAVSAPGSLGTVTRMTQTATGAEVEVEMDNKPDCAVTVRPAMFMIASPDNPSVAIATRKQLPLLLGYGITIARSQGLTLDKVEVVFSRSNWAAAGLAYVALSRCRSRSDLRVIGLKACHVIVDSLSLQFYEELPYW